jgi:sulfite reductase (NADPH) flavoprotein alpha-component
MLKTSLKPALLLCGVGTALYLTYKIVLSNNNHKKQSHNNPTIYSLESLLANAKSSSGSQNKPLAKPKFEQKRPPQDHEGIPILILYGTEYGYSKEIAENLTMKLCKIPEFIPRCLSTENYHFINFEKEQVILLVVSTQGDGVPPTAAKECWDYFMYKTSKGPEWESKLYSVLALGDSNYPRFCNCGRGFDKRFEELGCKRLYKRVDVDQVDDAVVNSWIDGVVTQLIQQHIQSQLKPIRVKDDYLWEKLDEGASNPGHSFSRTRPFFATMIVKCPLTIYENRNNDKETIHIEFDLADSGITYTPGDSLGILPENSPVIVDKILNILKFDPQFKVPIPKWFYKLNENVEEMTLREALLKCYDIKNVKPDFLRMLQITCSNREESKKIAQLFAKGSTITENVSLAAYLKEREIVDVIQEYRSATLTPAGFLNQLKPLLPRYYSISSTQLMDKQKVSITVAVVRYQTLNTERVGVCSTYLQDRVNVGEKCPIYVNVNPYFRLPKDPSLPIIMIGPGTGIAPFRAFIYERLRTNASGKNILYFGCRNKNRDFLYKNELTELATQGHLTLRTAFSRDQPNKVYVQDLLKEDAVIVWDLLQKGAHVYVCGDASQMAPDVHKTLLEIISKQGQMERNAAQKYIDELDKQNRYQRDVWIS